jgi:hypothetical protein
MAGNAASGFYPGSRFTARASLNPDTRKLLKICVAHLLSFDTFPRS